MLSRRLLDTNKETRGPIQRRMKMKRFLLGPLPLALVTGAAYAADDAPAAGAKPPAPEVKPVPKEDKYVSHHSADIGGRSIGYTATFGNLVIKNDKDESVASMSYVAYVADGNKDTDHRAV